IGFVNGPLTWRTSNQKLTGFVRSAFDFNLPLHYITSVADPWNTADVTALLKSLLASEWKQVTALVGAYESIGVAALRAAKALGMDVPTDLSVLTCPDEGTACSGEPPLATVALPVVRMGKLAALLVVSATRNADVIGTRFVVQPALVVRESTAPPVNASLKVYHQRAV